MRLALGKDAFIHRPVGEPGNPFAANFAINPFAGIFIAIRQPIGAAAVLKPILERAFVNAAIVILLGAYGPVLRRGGQCQRHTKHGRRYAHGI